MKQIPAPFDFNFQLSSRMRSKPDYSLAAIIPSAMAHRFKFTNNRLAMLLVVSGLAVFAANLTQAASLPTIIISDASVTEGNSGTTNAVFTVNLNTPSAQTITVNYATADITATLADNDYQSASGTLTFDPGQTNRTITVVVNGDTKFEPNEFIRVILSNATN